MEQHGKIHGNKPRGKLDLNLENLFASVITLKIAEGELMYGRDICKNPEGYTWSKTYYYYMFQSFLKMFNYSLDRNRVSKIKIAYPRNVFIYKMNEIVMFNLQ